MKNKVDFDSWVGAVTKAGKSKHLRVRVKEKGGATASWVGWVAGSIPGDSVTLRNITGKKNEVYITSHNDSSFFLELNRKQQLRLATYCRNGREITLTPEKK